MEYKVSLDLSELISAGQSAITAAVMPTVSQAVRALAAEAAYRWKDTIEKAKLWDGEKQEYIQSISWRMDGDFSAVVETSYKLAGDIETGRPARDMKRMLDTSLKTRVVTKGKNAGKKYLIIPFRHNTPGNTAHAPAMPVSIHKMAVKLDASTVTGVGKRLSGTGAFSMKTRKPITVPQKTYSWGARLPAGLAPKLKDFHTTDIYAGMVRMKTSSGGSNSSSYMTFRVMMEGSAKWIVPAKSGLYIAQKISQQLSLEAPAVIAKAFSFLK